MAEETKDSFASSFSIQDTMEMGMGNRELLDSLHADDSTGGNPEDITPIVKEVEKPEPPQKPEVPAGKEVVAKKEGEELTGPDLISNFLGSDPEEEEEEEEVLKATKPSQKTTTTEDEDAPEESSTFKSLSNDLFKLGVFSKDDEDEEEDISTPEQFLEKFNSEKKKGASEMIDNFLNQFGEDYRNAFNAIFVKGADPKEYFSTYNELVNAAELDLTIEDNQVKVMQRTLKAQGFEDEDIESEIERLKNYGDLESVSAKHHKVLIKNDAKKLEDIQEQAAVETQNKIAIKNQYIQNVQTILDEKLKLKEFDGIPLNPKLANELQEFLLMDKWQTKSGESLTDFDRTILDLKRPENHATKVKVGLILTLLKTDPNLLSIQKRGVTKTTDKLFSEVARQVTTSSTGKTEASKASITKWNL